MQRNVINAADSARQKFDDLFSKKEDRDYSEYPVEESVLKTILILSRTFFIIRIVVIVVLIVSSLVYTSWLLKAPVEKRDSSYDAWKLWFGEKGMYSYVLSLITSILLLILIRVILLSQPVQDKLKTAATNLAFTI